MHRLVIVSGVSGVGKSEALRSMRDAFAGRVGDVAVLETDHFHMMVDPHWTARSPEIERYYEVAGRLVRATAHDLMRMGFSFVAIGSNGLWEEANVREFVEPFLTDDVNVHHMTLDPGLDVILRRTASRAAANGHAGMEQPTPNAIELQLARFREHYGQWTHVLDNSALTPAETAVAIFDAVEKGRGVVH